MRVATKLFAIMAMSCVSAFAGSSSNNSSMDIYIGFSSNYFDFSSISEVDKKGRVRKPRGGGRSFKLRRRPSRSGNNR